MKSDNLTLGLAVVVAAGGLIIGWHEHALRIAAQRNSEQSNAELANTRTQVRLLQHSLRDAQTTPKAPVQAAVADTFTPRGNSTIASLQASILSSPEYQKLSVEEYRAGLELRYAGLYHRLGLSPSQISAFEDAKARVKQTVVDATAAAIAENLPLSNSGLADILKTSEMESDATLRSLLGESGFASYKTYQQLEPVRVQLSPLVNTLSSVGAPLSGEQAEQLAQVVATNTKKPSISGVVANSSSSTDWPSIYSQAGGFLSASQIDVLRAFGTDTQLTQRLSGVTRSLVKSSGP
jgi:hypothetical protein